MNALQTIFYSILFFIFLLTSACNSGNSSQHTLLTGNRFEYAHNIFSEQGSNRVVVYLNPQHSDSIVYMLTAEKPEKSYDATSKTFYIQTPIQRVAITSTTDIAPVAALHETQSLIAVCEIFRSCNPEVHALHAAHNIVDIGSEFHENVEKIIAIRPNILIKTVFTTAFTQNDALYLHANIPIIYSNNWQETNPLGRAEWIKFFGMLYNKEHEADSMFTVISNSYNEQKARYANTNKRPRVLAGEMVKNIWYAPGGSSYMAQFIADAGGEYIFANNNERGSIPLNFEQVLQKSNTVDVWIGSRFNSFKELFAENHVYSLLPITKTTQCYNYNKTQHEQCNDYFETGTLRPDYVLADFIRILHGDSLAGKNCRFLQQLY
ncbi:MAG: ABC transporter substrate-binding protein [Bacteroidales bacterium]|jgi:iron complex transport system substrate-binding protein|nr:ABC transporter substrate-binding protein [Bacteroidales bacterium]